MKWPFKRFTRHYITIIFILWLYICLRESDPELLEYNGPYITLITLTKASSTVRERRSFSQGLLPGFVFIVGDLDSFAASTIIDWVYFFF